MRNDVVSSSWAEYTYLDSGDGRRLERFGPHIVVRPSPGAVWRPTLPSSAWRAAAATYERNERGGGAWTFHRELPESWTIRWNHLRFLIKPTSSGQMGLFPEQEANWRWIADVLRAAKGEPHFLNLFGYTGASTLAGAPDGRVCHVDAVRGVVKWASENAELSGLAARPVRWIIDDAHRFLKREARRGRRYDAVALDPPTFGRGSKGQVFKIERDIAVLLDHVAELLSDDALFVLFTCHTPGIGVPALRNLLAPLTRARGGRVVAGDVLQLADREGIPPLPCGVFARWEGEAMATPPADRPPR